MHVQNVHVSWSPAVCFQYNFFFLTEESTFLVGESVGWLVMGRCIMALNQSRCTWDTALLITTCVLNVLGLSTTELICKFNRTGFLNYRLQGEIHSVSRKNEKIILWIIKDPVCSNVSETLRPNFFFFYFFFFLKQCSFLSPCFSPKPGVFNERMCSIFESTDCPAGNSIWPEGLSTERRHL